MIVYSALNTETGKRYIGLTTKALRVRRDRHLEPLRNNRHINKHFQQAYNANPDAFLWVILDSANTLDQLRRKEMFWIQHYCSHLPEYGYNKTRGGDGARLTEEGKQKLRDRFTGKSNWWKGRKRSEANRQRISQAQRGKKLAPERVASMRQEASERWKNPQYREKNSGHYPAFVHRETGEFIPAGIGLSQVCRERELSQRHMWSVQHGKRKSHKGWTLGSN